MPDQTMPDIVKPGDLPPAGHNAESTPATRKATRDFLVKHGLPVPPELAKAIADDDAAAKRPPKPIP